MSIVSLKTYKAVLGKMFTRKDLSEWREKNYLQYFEFLRRYLNANGKIGVTKIKLKENEDLIMNGPPSAAAEFLYRVGVFTTSGFDVPTRQFQKKLEQLTGRMGEYLKAHPALVTKAMEKELETIPHLSYVLTHFHTYQTDMGPKITLPDITGPQRPTKVPESPEVILAEAQLKMADMIRLAIDEISDKEIKKLSTKDKLALVGKFWPLVTATKFKPGLAVFQTININRAGRDDLEKTLMDFGKVRDAEEI